MATYTDIEKWNKDFKKKFEETIKQTNETVAHEAEVKASNLVPVDTSNLKQSIRSGVDGNTIWVGAGFKKEVTYAKHVEYGTWKMRAQPFLTPAAWQAAKEYPQILKEVANRIFK